jgi:hypothetical protein
VIIRITAERRKGLRVPFKTTTASQAKYRGRTLSKSSAGVQSDGWTTVAYRRDIFHQTVATPAAPVGEVLREEIALKRDAPKETERLAPARRSTPLTLAPQRE